MPAPASFGGTSAIVNFPSFPVTANQGVFRTAMIALIFACMLQNTRTMPACLNVSTAFHTPLLAPAARRLRAALDAISWKQPGFPVVTNLAAQPYDDPAEIPEVLEQQLRSPVLWAECVQTLGSLGCDVFLEVGPKRALTGMLRELAPGATALSVSAPAEVEELALPAA